MIFKAKVLEKKQLTPKILEITLQLLSPETVEFIAGQFMMLEVGDVRRRPYSIVSLPESVSKITFCVDFSPNGLGSQYIKKLEVGDGVQMQGPFGVFTVKNLANDLLFVATGAGIAPFLPMIKDLLVKGFEKNITLLFGVRDEENAFYFDYFSKLAEVYKNFNFIPSLSQPKNETQLLEQWHGFKGRVTKYLQENFDAKNSTSIYICGGPPMIKDVRAILIDKKIDPLNIKFEVFT